MGRRAAQFGGDLTEALHDGIDGFVERGGAGGNTDVARVAEPRWIEFVCAFDLQRAQAMGGGFLGELARVVAVSAADDNDVVAFADQIIHRVLSLFCWMADRVDETHLRAAMEPFDGFHEPQGHLNRLCGLRNDAEMRMRWDFTEIAFIENDNGLGKVADEAAHFDMLTLPDDDGLIAVIHECGERVMCLFHKRTGGVDDIVSCLLPSLAMLVGGTVGCDGDLMRGGTGKIVEIALSSTDCCEMAIDERIVDELTEDGQRGALCGGVRGTQSVADAETHAVMLSEDDVHLSCSWFLVELCVTK